MIELTAFAVLALAASVVQAQDAPGNVEAAAVPDIELGIDGGAVLVSTGGEFTQAADGQAVAPGHRVLVSEDASATLTYDNGCRKTLSTAGVYIVTPDCDTTVAAVGGPSAGMIAGVVGGVAVIAAAAGGGGGSSNRPPPVSR